MEEKKEQEKMKDVSAWHKKRLNDQKAAFKKGELVHVKIRLNGVNTKQGFNPERLVRTMMAETAVPEKEFDEIGYNVTIVDDAAASMERLTY